MTPQEARTQITTAMNILNSVRDTLGDQLCQAKASSDLKNSETRDIIALHDRVARAISAYKTGR